MVTRSALPITTVAALAAAALTLSCAMHARPAAHVARDQPARSDVAPQTVGASIVAMPRDTTSCGTFEVWTTIEVAADRADSATMRVEVPCLELARGDYNVEDRDAGRLVLGRRYRFELASRGGSWRAVHIHAP